MSTIKELSHGITSDVRERVLEQMLPVDGFKMPDSASINCMVDSIVTDEIDALKDWRRVAASLFGSASPNTSNALQVFVDEFMHKTDTLEESLWLYLYSKLLIDWYRNARLGITLSSDAGHYLIEGDHLNPIMLSSDIEGLANFRVNAFKTSEYGIVIELVAKLNPKLEKIIEAMDD